MVSNYKHIIAKNFSRKTIPECIFTKVFSVWFCKNRNYRFGPSMTGEPVDQETNKKFSMSQIYLGPWYKKPFVDISYGLPVIMLNVVGSPTKNYQGGKFRSQNIVHNHHFLKTDLPVYITGESDIRLKRTNSVVIFCLLLNEHKK